MSFDTTARSGVAPQSEEQSHRLPADGFFVRCFEKGGTMINPYHASVIDRLREAAKEHGEVAELLEVIAESFPYFPGGDVAFYGDEKQRAYILAAMNAAAFVAVDRGVMLEGEGE